MLNTDQPVISLLSPYSLIYKKPVDHPDPIKFNKMMDRRKKAQDLYTTKNEFKEDLNNFLIPETNSIR